MGGKAHKASTLHEDLLATEQCWEQEDDPPREEDTKRFSSAERPALKTYTQVQLYRLNRLYLGTNTHTPQIHICMYATRVKEAAVKEKESGERCWQGLGGEKGREKSCNIL